MSFSKLIAILLPAGILFYATADAQSNAAPAARMTPQMTEIWEPEVPVVRPGNNNSAPSDAIILFDGKNLDQWRGKGDSKAAWKLSDGNMIVEKGSGSIWTRQDFNDFQLHIEWSAPAAVDGSGQGRGNSGVILQDRYEVQILDSYNNRTYSNGQAGSIYKQYPPLVNAMNKPGEWNTYDIIYTAPRFKDSGALFSAAKITLIHNGIVVQNDAIVKGTVTNSGLPVYERHGAAPIQLQNHNNPVMFRNIWLREL